MNERSLTTTDGAELRGFVDGTGPPLVMCHGGPGLWDYFDAFATDLCTSHTVHRWDQRGCGRSASSSTYGLDVAVRDVQDVKVAFGVRDPWVVLGHSWGAYLALLSALENPESVRALIYVSGNGTPGWWRDIGSAIDRAERSRRTPRTRRHRLEQLDGMERDWNEEVEFRRLSWITDFVDQDDPPEALDAMASMPLPINRDVNRALSRAQLYPDDQLLAACDQCQVPSLFIHGSEDPRSPAGAQLLSQRLPNARFVIIDGAGHLPWVERRHETLRTVENVSRRRARLVASGP